MSMKTILMHNNDGNPISIMLSDDMVFHTIEQGKSLCTSNSLRAAIDHATNKFINKDAPGILGWQTCNQ